MSSSASDLTGSPSWWNRLLAFAAECGFLAQRAGRELLRTPSRILFPIGVPLLQLIAYKEVLGRLTELPGFGARTTVEFGAAGAIVLSVMAAIGGAGFQMQQDLESGFFDRLRAAPISRAAIVTGLLLNDGLRYACHALVMLLVALILGAKIASGLVGALLIVLLVGFVGACWSGVGLNVALSTRSAESTASSTVFVLPLYFASTALMPAALLPEWLRRFNVFNPVNWLVVAVRGLMLHGVNAAELSRAFAGGVLIAAITLPLSVRALSRTLQS